MAIRAKMTVVEKREYGGYGGSKTHGVKLQAVAGGDGNAENQAFWQATPSGQIDLSVMRQEVAGAFELGKAYYVDFTPAE